MRVVEQIRGEFKKLANPRKAKLLAGFFKTAKGEYDHGDKFYGVNVPTTRLIAKNMLRRRRCRNCNSFRNFVKIYFLRFVKYVV